MDKTTFHWGFLQTPQENFLIKQKLQMSPFWPEKSCLASALKGSAWAGLCSQTLCSQQFLLPNELLGFNQQPQGLFFLPWITTEVEQYFWYWTQGKLSTQTESKVENYCNWSPLSWGLINSELEITDCFLIHVKTKFKKLRQLHFFIYMLLDPCLQSQQ